MLSELFGGKSVERVLYFLLINEKCYATQLHKQLATPLTPIQKALAKLEKAGVLKSVCEGKTRFYQMHPLYPLRKELEQCIRKGYELLSVDERRTYHFVERNKGSSALTHKQSQEALLACWKRLKNVRHLLIHAKQKNSEQKGKGDVTVVEINNQLLFTEQGHWEAEHQMRFNNQLRWTLDLSSGSIALERMRQDQSVLLVYLKPKREGFFESIDSHLCGQDAYFGQLHCDEKFLQLSWRILGPKKNERLDCLYL